MQRWEERAPEGGRQLGLYWEGEVGARPEGSEEESMAEKMGWRLGLQAQRLKVPRNRLAQESPFPCLPLHVWNKEVIAGATTATL